MSRLRWLWRELTRPRGSESHRFYRGGRGSRSGLALLLALTTVLLVVVVASELTQGSSTRLRLAVHQRDEAKATALAETGVHLYRLVLVASKGLGQQIAPILAQFGIPADSLWQMVPFINTGMMRMLLVSGGSVDEGDVAEFEENGLTEEQVAETREESASGSKRNFLDFDGDFFAEVVDEDSKVYVGQFTATSYAELTANPAALQLYGVMGGEDNDAWFRERNIEKWELIGNLADWTDADDMRLYQGGSEDNLYLDLPVPYRSKNTTFESMAELRLVDGWHRDDVWERFGESLTIYGSGAVNVNTAQREVLLGLLRAYAVPNTPVFQEQLLREIELYRSIANYSNGQAFVAHLESLGATVDPRMAQAVKTESTIFRVTSSGQVGESVVTIEAVFDFTQNPLGTIVYWRVQ
jgi:type II secretory pathway component PulK